MSGSFESVLNQYKRATLEYKVTGQTVFKDQAARSEAWLKQYLTGLNQAIQRDATYIDRFVKTYEKTNPDIVKFTKEIKLARTKGPELQDIYEGEQEVRKEVPVDESVFYTKAAVIGGVLAIGAVVSFL
jgi:anion-transporting  ArsA/GET3 family ATPase